MANDYDVSSLIDDSSSPLRASGINPRDAIKDPKGVMAYLQNLQYGAGVDKPSSLKENTLQPNQVPMATAGAPTSQPTDWGAMMTGKPSDPGTAGANVSNGQPASDPDLDRTRELANYAQQQTEKNQTAWDARQQQRADLEAQRSKDAGYIDPHGTSPTTGASYKPSTGRQVLRGVMGAAEGLAKGGLFGAAQGALNPRNVGQPGYNDPTVQYGRDAARQAAAVASDDQHLKEMKDESKDVYDAGRNLGTDTSANAKTFGDIFTAKRNAAAAETAAKQADTRQQHEDDTEQYNRNRADVADRNATTNARKTDALITAALARANKDDRTTPAGSKGVAAIKMQSYADAHGIDLNTTELTPDQLGEALRIGAGPAHAGDAAKISALDVKFGDREKKLQDWYDQNFYGKQVNGNEVLPDVSGNKDSDPAKQRVVDKFAADRKALHDEKVAAYGAFGVQINDDGSSSQAQQPAAQSKPAAAARPRQDAASNPPTGATMKVPGSDGKLHWSDGKRDMGIAQ